MSEEHAAYGVLPPFDPTTLRTAFPVATQRMIVDWFVAGKSVDYLVRWFHCEVADIEHVLRVALDSEA